MCLNASAATMDSWQGFRLEGMADGIYLGSDG